MKRLVILISGRGSNMQALLQARLPATVSAVISNNPQARAGWSSPAAAGVHTARRSTIATIRDRDAFDRALTAEIDAARIPTWSCWPASCASSTPSSCSATRDG